MRGCTSSTKAGPSSSCRAATAASSRFVRFAVRPCPTRPRCRTNDEFDAMLEGKFFPQDVVAWMRALPFFYEDEHATMSMPGSSTSAMASRIRRRSSHRARCCGCAIATSSRTIAASSSCSVIRRRARCRRAVELHAGRSDRLVGRKVVVGLDTACGKGGFLTAFELPAQRVYGRVAKTTFDGGVHSARFARALASPVSVIVTVPLIVVACGLASCCSDAARLGPRPKRWRAISWRNKRRRRRPRSRSHWIKPTRCSTRLASFTDK